MSIPYVIDGETDLDSTTINRWIENINTVPLGSITGALEGYAPLQNMRAGVVNVRDHGAVGDGSTDDTAAIRAAATAVAALYRTNPGMGESTNRLGGAKLVFPAGSYRITESDALVVLAGLRVSGLIIEGAGKGATQIIFAPASAVTHPYLIDNAEDGGTDGYLGLQFRGISFLCDTAGASFMRSDSDGGPQNYYFDSCVWKDFTYGFHLTGSNVNSEFTWVNCGFSGAWTTTLWIEDSDQFVNYNFYATNWECSTGTFIKADKGGSINIFGGSLISTNDALLFDLNGTTHAYGTERLLVVGCRIELRTTSSRAITCDWGAGAVSWISCDFSVNASVGSFVNSIYTFTTVDGPTVRYDGCRLEGQHEYVYSVSNWGKHPIIDYVACSNVHHDDPHDMVVFTPASGHTNLGGQPIARFRSCRGTTYDHTWDADVGWHHGNRATTTPKIVSLKNAAGRNPSNSSEPVILPLNAVVTRARVAFPPFGSSVSTAWTITLASGEPSTLLTLNPGTQLKNGADSDWVDLFYKCDTDDKRTITLAADSGVNQTTTEFLALVEYIG